MPRCLKCDKVQPSAEVRRVAHGHVCKDKTRCDERTREVRERIARLTEREADVLRKLA